MERATHIDKDGWYINGANVAAVFHSSTGEIRMSGKDIARLAAYEDTGLEPEDLKRAFNEDAVLKLAGQALGITPERLRELAQSDKEGLCVVMLCQPGDKISYKSGAGLLCNAVIDEYTPKNIFITAKTEIPNAEPLSQTFSISEVEAALRGEQE